MVFVIDAPCKKLKKCPWCKERPKLFKKELWHGSHGYRGNYDYYVKCDNINCKIQPQTTHYSDVYKDASYAINKACSDWNDRGGNNEKN